MTEAEAFPNLTFAHPVHVANAGDGTDRLFVVEKRGQIRVFPNDPAVAADAVQVFLDIRDRVDSAANEAGLLSVAFDPAYAEAGHFYVNYTTSAPGTFTTRISRFQVTANPHAADPASELVIHAVAQPYQNHNGGQIAFGPDGYLYVGHGDGGAGGDPLNSGQDLSSVLGKMLRIDVAGATAAAPYAIPPDNPFADADPAVARPEVFAWGLRNPWRFSFDRVTGTLWAGDVGQDAWEEVDIVRIGRNYGWRIMEGYHCYAPNFQCDESGLELPVVEYGHAVGESITGGHVYRGTATPSLYGAYVYGDYVSGVVFAARFGATEQVEVSKIAQTGLFLSSFGEDEAGELYLVDYPFSNPNNGKLWRLTPQAASPASTDFPLTLSGTGCFTDLATMTPAQGVLPYTVNASLWHDGAQSERYLVLPGGGKMAAAPVGAWTLPAGTRLIKTFVFERPGEEPFRVETRFVVVDADGVRAYAYRWNDAQTDAELVSDASEWSFDVLGEPTTWHFPSRSQCLSCHNAAAGHVLGWHTGQLNREGAIGGVVGNQLSLFDQLGVVTGLPAAPAQYPDPADTAAPAAARARAALFANCATCHLENGPTTTPLDLRFETALADTQACDVDPEKGDLGVAGAKILMPGVPEKSTLALRMRSLGPERMPNLGSFVVDGSTAELVEAWIAGLPGCSE